MDRATASKLISIGQKFNMDIYGYLPSICSPTAITQAYKKEGFEVVVKQHQTTTSLSIYYQNKRIVPIKLNKNI